MTLRSGPQLFYLLFSHKFSLRQCIIKVTSCRMRLTGFHSPIYFDPSYFPSSISEARTDRGYLFGWVYKFEYFFQNAFINERARDLADIRDF